jgi:cytoskeletal protein RodZ
MGADEPSGDFGHTLRVARERRGMSLRQIANATKISVTLLEALERNDIKRLPGGLFSRGFVRAYAREVGLDPEATVRDFLAEFPHEPAVGAGRQPDPPGEDHAEIESRRQSAVAFVQLLAASVLVTAIVLYIGASSGPRSEPDQTPVPPVAAATLPAEPPLTSVAPPDQPLGVQRAVEPALATAATAGIGPAAIPAPLTIVISATRACWISATVDGAKVVERTLEAGDARTLHVANELALTLGDAGAVSVTINGEATRPLGGDGQVVTTHLAPANVRTFLAAR